MTQFDAIMFLLFTLAAVIWVLFEWESQGYRYDS